ncbi:hypothetical protein RB195_002078 [Necator americanus]|uniref:Uncharacterized protein n=1 Tax=Necator americanus TaxID=51031 RepID=A0ABR1DH85_NECAM
MNFVTVIDVQQLFPDVAEVLAVYRILTTRAPSFSHAEKMKRPHFRLVCTTLYRSPYYKKISLTSKTSPVPIYRSRRDKRLGEHWRRYEPPIDRARNGASNHYTTPASLRAVLNWSAKLSVA